MNSEEIKKYYQKISENPLDHLSQYVAPQLVGQEWYWIRRAILMILATQNDMHLRNRLHMLLVGAAGLGKTEILLWIRENLDGIMINAELTSKVGLVGDARGSQITPGLLSDADENILCLHPESRILINNRLLKIEKFYLSSTKSETISLNQYLTCNSSVSNIIKRTFHGNMITIETSNGFSIKITDNHLLLDGHSFLWKQAKNFSEGDYLVSPLFYPQHTNEIYLINILPDDIKILLSKEQQSSLRQEIYNKYTYRGFFEKFGFYPYKILQKNMSMRADTFRKILHHFNIYEIWKEKLFKFCYSHHSDCFLVNKITPEMCYLIGFCVGDGAMQKKCNYIIQSSVHKKQIDKIKGYWKKIYGKYPTMNSHMPKPTHINNQNIIANRIYNIYFNKQFHVIYDYFTKNDFENLLELNNECLSAFYAGLIDSDGCICIKNNNKYKVLHIELALGLSKKENQTLLIGLRRLSCYGSIAKSGNNIKISITGREDAINLIENIKERSIKANISIPLKKLPTRTQRDNAPVDLIMRLINKIYNSINTSYLVTRGLASTFDDYRKGKRIPNKKILKEIVKKLDDLLDKNIKKEILDICSNSYCLEKIIKIKSEKYDGAVYDLEVPTYHNFMVEGLLVHNCADELDKANIRDQNGLLQAMEEGTYCVVKGKHRQRFKSEVRVIATANEMEKIQKPLLDRFDFIFYVGTSTRRERADNVGKIVNSFTSEQEKDYGKAVLEYLEWIGDYNASMTLDDEPVIKNMIGDYILKTQTNIDYVSYRSLELSILRIAYAMAKLERTTTKGGHVKDAIWLKDQILRNVVGEYDRNKKYR